MVRVYLYGVGQKVIIPQIAETEAGFLVEQEPVTIFDVQDLPQWKALAYKYLKEGNPVIPTPEENVTPGSPILEMLGLKKWDDFERKAVMYTVHVGARGVAVYSTGRNEQGKWTTGEKERTFASEAPLEVVIDEMALDLIKEPEAVAKPVLLLGG